MMFAAAGDLVRLGDKAFASGQYTQAIDMYSQAIALDPKSQLFFFKRAAVHLSKKSFDQALSDLDKALALDATFIKV
jgi:tetratricopeptide (TPR) repeat protein